MTTTAPNLGKLFTSRTSRPATSEDIALLAPGDWITERECSWSWQFKNSCQDMAVGVWEGKEFFIPHHLLMVCEIIEGQVVEKFFKKSEPKLKVGDRVRDTFNPRRPRTGTIADTPEIWAVIHWDGVKHSPNGQQWSYEYLEIIQPEKFSNFSVGDHLEITNSFGDVTSIKVIHVHKNNIYQFQFPGGAKAWASVTMQGDKIGLEIRTAPHLGAEIIEQKFQVGDRVVIKNDGSKLRRYKGLEAVIHAPQKTAGKYLCNVLWEGKSFHSRYFGDNDLCIKAVAVSESEQDRWNPAHFGSTLHQIEEDGQTTIFYDTANEPPEPDDFETVEEFEEAWKQWENLPQEYCLPVVAAVHKVRSRQDTSLSGQSKTTLTPQPSTESDSQTPNSLSKTLPNSQTNLSEISTVSISSLGEAHARISALLENAPGLKELADNCFLNTSDVCKSSSLQLFCGRTLAQSYQVERGKTSSKSLMRLRLWGMWGLGKLETETATFPKTENDYSVWVFTGDIRATLPKPTKKSLQEIFNGVNSVTGEEIDEAFTLTASTPKLGAGNKSHPNTFVSIPVKVYVDGVAEATESPALCSGGWQHRSPLHRDKRGADARSLLASPLGRRLGLASLSFAVLYRAASGDRLYHEECPTLRSLSNTGNHQSGSGAYKIREYQGESYLERPINATEAEQLMGWEIGSTVIGVNKEGDEITISQTQRIKMIGNGIIPAEITDILTAIKPMLERKLESEVPENMRFAYRQLRQRGMSHQDAMRCFPPQASLF